MSAKDSSWQRLCVAFSLVSELRVPHYQDKESPIPSSQGWQLGSARSTSQQQIHSSGSRGRSEVKLETVSQGQAQWYRPVITRQVHDDKIGPSWEVHPWVGVHTKKINNQVWTRLG